MVMRLKAEKAPAVVMSICAPRLHGLILLPSHETPKTSWITIHRNHIMVPLTQWGSKGLLCWLSSGTPHQHGCLHSSVTRNIHYRTLIKHVVLRSSCSFFTRTKILHLVCSALIPACIRMRSLRSGHGHFMSRTMAPLHRSILWMKQAQCGG